MSFASNLHRFESVVPVASDSTSRFTFRRAGQFISAVLFCGVLTPLAHAGDETWINAAIAAAIKNGQHSYSLPAGTYDLSSPIVIPEGTRNFKLEGMGSKSTFLTAKKQAITYAISVGRQPIMFNDWGFGPANAPNSPVKDVHQGDTWVTYTGTLPINIGKYYVLYDNNIVSQSAAPFTAQNNRRSLVQIIAWDKTNGRVELDSPAARDFNQSPEIAYVDPFTCANITVQGFGFNGSVTGSTTSFSNGVCEVGIADEVTLTDLSTVNFSTRSIQCAMTRNVNATNLYTANGLNTQDPGSAYGPTFCFCRYVTVTNSLSTLCRHGFVNENGTTDAVYNGDQVTGTNGNFDSHGFDERRISYNSCKATGTFNMGNANWLGGEQDFTLNNCLFDGQAWVGPNAYGLTVNNSSFSGVQLYSVSGNVGIPSSGYPNGLEFNECSFSASTDLLQGAGSAVPLAGSVVFNDCDWNQTSAVWGTAINLTTVGNFQFINNRFTSTSTRTGDVPMVVNTAKPGLQLTVKGTTITAPATSYGVQLVSTLASSRISFSSTVFKSGSNKVTPHLVLNQSKVGFSASGTN